MIIRSPYKDVAHGQIHAQGARVDRDPPESEIAIVIDDQVTPVPPGNMKTTGS